MKKTRFFQFIFYKTPLGSNLILCINNVFCLILRIIEIKQIIFFEKTKTIHIMILNCYCRYFFGVEVLALSHAVALSDFIFAQEAFDPWSRAHDSLRLQINYSAMQFLWLVLPLPLSYICVYSVASFFAICYMGGPLYLCHFLQIPHSKKFHLMQEHLLRIISLK